MRCKWAIWICLSFLVSSVAFCQPDVETHREKDFCLEVLRPKAESGDAKSQYLLGGKYELGSEVPADIEEAMKWYRKAAEQGLVNAQRRLATLYALGYGVPQDLEEAAKWLREAAEQGMGKAQEKLGLLYSEGVGVPKDLVQAYMWCDLAGLQGLAKARSLKAALIEKMSLDQIAEAQAKSAAWRNEHRVELEDFMNPSWLDPKASNK